MGGVRRVPEDPEELVYLRVAVEERLLGGQLGEDGADAPHVHGRGVARGAQQDLGRAVPQGHHLGGQTHTSNTQHSTIFCRQPLSEHIIIPMHAVVTNTSLKWWWW